MGRRNKAQGCNNGARIASNRFIGLQNARSNLVLLPLCNFSTYKLSIGTYERDDLNYNSSKSVRKIPLRTTSYISEYLNRVLPSGMRSRSSANLSKIKNVIVNINANCLSWCIFNSRKWLFLNTLTRILWRCFQVIQELLLVLYYFLLYLECIIGNYPCKCPFEGFLY